MSEAKYIPRKFYKIWGLNKVFTATNGVYNTKSLNISSELYVDGKIDDHTIIFFTANSEDVGIKVNVYNNETVATSTGLIEHELSEYDTLLWARGDVYFVKGKTVKSVTYENNKLKIVYTDGTSSEYTVSGGSSYSAGTNIDISLTNEISATGYSYDDYKFRTDNGIIVVTNDVYGGSNEYKPDYILSDMHSVISSDWYDFPAEETPGSFDESYDNSYTNIEV